ncbi:MAG: polymer-forming cytoskeletal protein, partial [Clostridiales bacterium]|nr:polymer-forming cytoskeletal protein [Clostridiales bacterium]
VVNVTSRKPTEEEIAAMETLINADTIINGSIVSKNALRIQGTVEGDVSTTSAMDVSGDITGKVVAKELNLNGGTVEGNVNCVEQMTMDSSSMILGDISAKELVLDGKVKGNVNVGGSITIKANSIILGDISASMLQMEQGSTVCGKISITSNEKKLDESLFVRKKKQDE